MAKKGDRALLEPQAMRLYADGFALIHDQIEAAAYCAVGAERRN